ncbi:hypothetical protein GCM10011359_23100 [Nesterenkonia alkaliphila]|nr:hypothetical protein GCM10011359_23100 [Nesterenkonia alkaliphila]
MMLSIAAALTSMVAGYTEPEQHQQEHLTAVHRRARGLREKALTLADDDATASQAFGAAFRRKPGPDREDAIHRASILAAKASAVVGVEALAAIEDLEWLVLNGKSALIADVVVSLGALRAAMTGARTNVSYDLAALTCGDSTLDDVEQNHPELWDTVKRLNEGLEHVDQILARIADRAVPTASR